MKPIPQGNQDWKRANFRLAASLLGSRGSTAGSKLVATGGLRAAVRDESVLDVGGDGDERLFDVDVALRGGLEEMNVVLL